MSQLESRGWRVMIKPEYILNEGTHIDNTEIDQVSNTAIPVHEDNMIISLLGSPCPELEQAFIGFQLSVIHRDGISFILPEDKNSRSLYVKYTGGSKITKEMEEDIRAEVEDMMSSKITETERHTFVRECVNIQKKIQETFLTELVFQISNAIIFVVDSNSWSDLKQVHALSDQLKRYNIENPGSLKFERLLVIHNCKDLEISKLTKLRNYISSMFPNGVEISRDISINHQIYQSKTWYSQSDHCQHFFLIDGSTDEGRNCNNITLEDLKQSLSMRSLSPVTVMRRLMNCIDVLSKKYFSSDTDQSPTKLRYERNQFFLYRDDDNISRSLKGYYTDFQPDVDKLYCYQTNPYRPMILILDIPGFPDSADTNPEPYQHIELELEYLAGNKHNLVIKGEKALIQLTNDAYEKIESHLWENTRKSGEFIYKCEIPPGFTTDLSQITCQVKYGVLHVFIPHIKTLKKSVY
eukprot:TRINITY_DN428_c0_g3_i1.p1 TRINITY_DN428_c0_g3~~TRINITY_DN428_c0_g3_i1.p1  ORF type:complete len:466 (+),score=74.43 TRINITY_DN428_c0_g3_i1:558-1955(+)